MKKQVLFALAVSIISLLIVSTKTTAQQKPQEVSSCLECHGNAAKMKEMGFSQFAVTQQEVEKQTKMPASCTDCHLGNPKDAAKDGAHKGLLRLYYVKLKGFQAVTRDKLEKFKPESLEPRGKNQMIDLLPMVEKGGKLVKDPEVNTILFHDKNPEDLSFNYPVQEKTCGVCHPKQVEEFKKTAMGHNAKQSQYKTWTDKKRGPHNCGLWFVDNSEEIAKNTKVPYTQDMAKINQKACNQCHAGCLDCHYSPKKKDPNNPSAGSHTFTKKIAPQTCYGGGRGSICHAGPEDRRRGAGYIAGDYSNPKGLTPDVHYSKGLSCTDCHNTPATDKKLLHGQVKRQVSCAKCHNNAVKSMAKSVHKKVSCEACHIQDVGGYAATFWGPGKVAGVNTPFKKYKAYYGVMKDPILIKNQKGRWIPVKPYAMAAMNQKSVGELKPGLAWRFPANLPDLERTDDAYAFVGLLKGMPENDNVLAWIQMDKISHKYGRSRNCESCHTKDGEQRQEVSWKFTDQGAEPFEGKHTVVANKKGLFIKNMQAAGEIKVKEGWKLSSFAPWYYLNDKWHVKGNFSIPLVKKKAVYGKELGRYENITKTGEAYHK